MKKIITSLMLFFSVSFVFCERYKIDYVNFSITGITKEYAIEKAIDIDKTRIFESFNEFHNYVENLKQLFKNERNFSESIINVSYGDLDINGITTVTLNISTFDSKHFLMVPYPKYNSNDGFILKLKAKDTNFLGTMETLNTDINFSIEPQTDNPDVYDTIFGINFDYSYPFKLWKLDSKWNNDFSFDWTIGRTTPEYSFNTGLTFSLPFKNFSVELDIAQGIIKDFEYEKYGDSLYFTENATLSLPYKVGLISDYFDVTWTPYISYTQNIDKDGINIENKDLRGPSLNFGYSLSTGRYNWYENFRKGITFSFSQAIGFNYGTKKYVSTSNANVNFFSFFKIIGFNSQLQAFYNMNTDNKIGSYLRGIRDNQYYYNSTDKALETQAAIILNMDFPIHIISTDWIKWENALFGEESFIVRHTSWMKYFDFELQLNPFIDIALTDNHITNKTFSIKDGWYSGGLEILVFPKKWRSLVVRASFGVDLGKNLVKKVVPSLYDDSWRDNVSSYELQIGIGLHY